MAPLSSHPLYSDASWMPPEHACHLVHLSVDPTPLFVVTFPLSHPSAAAATSSPPVLLWLPLLHHTTEGTEPELIYPTNLLFQKVPQGAEPEIKQQKTVPCAANSIDQILNVGIKKNIKRAVKSLMPHLVAP